MKNQIYLIVLIALIIVSCEKEKESSMIKLTDHPTLGKILTDADGLSLYFFSKDISGESECDSNCLDNWPVFHLEDLTTGIPDGLDAGDFGTHLREDGTMQTTFKGWPLYYFAFDAVSGDVNGNGANKIWYVAKPDYSLMIGHNSGDNFLVDSRGVALYSFDLDSDPDASKCSGGCLDKWPLFYTSTLVLPTGLSAISFTEFTRADNGQTQSSFKGKPLYYYAPDNINIEQRGMTEGDGFNDVWHLFQPDEIQQ